jgi:putative phosphoesterase
VHHLQSSQRHSASCFIGIISDTHGLMRPEAIDALQGVSAIIHAGDIGSEAVLRTLETIAPVYAVRGNNDTAEWAAKIPTAAALTIAGISFYVLHNIHELDRAPRSEQVRVIISGHSHRPLIEERQGILFVNPGSAGPRRFTLPVSVAKLEIRAEKPIATLIELNVGIK